MSMETLNNLLFYCKFFSGLKTHENHVSILYVCSHPSTELHSGLICVMLTALIVFQPSVDCSPATTISIHLTLAAAHNIINALRVWRLQSIFLAQHMVLLSAFWYKLVCSDLKTPGRPTEEPHLPSHDDIRCRWIEILDWFQFNWKYIQCLLCSPFMWTYWTRALVHVFFF